MSLSIQRDETSTTHTPSAGTAKISLYDLARAAAQRGQTDEVFDVRHEDFDFVPDGWTAAVWVAHGFASKNDDLVKILSGRFCNSEEIFVESYAILRGAKGEVEYGEYDEQARNAAERYWRRVCNKFRQTHVTTEIARWITYDPSSPAPTSPPRCPSRTRSARTPRRAIHDPVVVNRDAPKLHLRFRAPLSYPTPFLGSHFLFGFISFPPYHELRESFLNLHEGHEPSDNDLRGYFLPSSPIFFAARFAHIRELSRELSRACHPDVAHSLRKEEERMRITRDIYQVLLCMLLYFTGVKAAEGRPNDLGFDQTYWKRVYERNAARGSEVFGLKDGFGLNREFLNELEDGEKLEEWYKGACAWWIEGDGDKEKRERELLRDGLRNMVVEILDILEDGRAASGNPTRGRSEAHVPINRRSLPLSPAEKRQSSTSGSPGRKRRSIQ